MRIKESTILPRVLYTVANGLIAASSPSDRTSRSVYRAFKKFDELQTVTNQQLQQSVRYAVGKRYITVTRKKGKTTIELTAKGKRLLGREALAALTPLRQKKWDKVYRIVLFDIPETQKNGRDKFAGHLKRMGCVQIQKSAFAFPYPCFEEVEVVAHFYDVGDFVTYLEASSLKPKEHFHKHFDL